MVFKINKDKESDSLLRKINIKDIALGFIMLGLSIYIFIGDNVILGNSIFKESIIIGRAEFYLKFLATVMILISLVLIIITLKKSRIKCNNESSIPSNNVVSLSFGALIIYVLVLKPLGFFLSSFLLTTFLSFIIRLRENRIDTRDKKLVLKSFLISCIFSLVSVLLIRYIFENGLNVILP